MWKTLVRKATCGNPLGCFQTISWAWQKIVWSRIIAWLVIPQIQINFQQTFPSGLTRMHQCNECWPAWHMLLLIHHLLEPEICFDADLILAITDERGPQLLLNSVIDLQGDSVTCSFSFLFFPTRERQCRSIAHLALHYNVIGAMIRRSKKFTRWSSSSAPIYWSILQFFWLFISPTGLLTHG